ncbi:hypothetical protein [Streptomyces sp. 2231.1]|uniref:hypothetical protein n=1 Tax=Streptomyces sp. 2231.1 TaxID=1855347 RepID=UPI00115F933E|nr:hypothetical protein [Streptomyces sp. 2231.1]
MTTVTKRKVRIELVDVECLDPEDILGGASGTRGQDELYVMGGVAVVKPNTKPVPVNKLVVPDMPITPGYPKPFPAKNAVLFDATANSNEAIGLGLSFWDRDTAESGIDPELQKHLDAMITSVGAAAGAAAGGVLAGIPGAVAGAFATTFVTELVKIYYPKLTQLDKDDHLGSVRQVVDLSTVNNGTHNWTWSVQGSTTFASWNYRVRARLSVSAA